jgi:predicted TIM-barrel fold metal-dependent hydrolase
VVRIDTHVHLVPERYRRELARRELLTFPLAPWSLEATLQLLERHEIDAAVMSLSPPGVWFGDVGLAAELARIVNEETAALVRSDPARFAGLGVVPLPDVSGAVAELAYALDVLGLDGIALLSNVGGVYHGDERWAPLWEELDRRGAYVFLHPAPPQGTLALAEHPVWLYEFPFDTTRAIVNLIYSGTLERHRDVRLQVSHLGGTIPFLAHRVASLAQREPDKAAAAPSGAENALQLLWYDTGLSNHRSAVDATRAVVPLERIVFGTDWPYAALPADGDPAPELEYLGSERRLVDASNCRTLVPRLFA